MKLKSYRCGSVDAAMRLARIELGGEAVFLGSRHVEDGGGGRVEATFALLGENETPNGAHGAKAAALAGAEPSPAAPRTLFARRSFPRAAASPAPAQAKPPACPKPAAPSTLESPVALDREIARLRLQAGLPGPAGASRQEDEGFAASLYETVFRAPMLSRLFARLVSRGVAPGFGSRLIAELEDELNAGAPLERLEEALASRIHRLWNVSPGLGADGEAPKVAALVGPTGAGKTTAAAKLAVRYGLERGKRLHLVCVDPLRVGATETLRAYAEILRAPLTVAAAPEGLPAVLDEIRRAAACDAVLIDTPGYGPADRARLERLRGVLEQVKNLDIHLTLSAVTRTEGIRQAAEPWSGLATRLLFTKLDETSEPGSLLSESLRINLPLSFVSAGQRVPEDLAAADPAMLTRLVLGSSRRAPESR